MEPTATGPAHTNTNLPSAFLLRGLRATRFLAVPLDEDRDCDLADPLPCDVADVGVLGVSGIGGVDLRLYTGIRDVEHIQIWGKHFTPLTDVVSSLCTTVFSL